MRTFKCNCGATIFFENTLCLTCGRELGWCPACYDLVTLLPTDDGGFRCGNPHCGKLLGKCHNYAVEKVCNRCIALNENGSAGETLCDCCRYNETIPDLTVEGNRQKWARLEQAKRRLFYGLNLLGLPYGKASDGFSPPLAFDFKADVIPADDRWHMMGASEQVYTGHANGKITINLKEADDVEREKLRVDLNEKHRTLIGHFRHEIGHYYWSMLVGGRCEADFVALFGDHNNPPYAQALERYYKQGPPADWSMRFVSEYAAMHPWEDFAETFATYLDMTSVLDTAFEMGFSGPTVTRSDDMELLVAHYQKLGVFMNEMNRAMGLIDYIPEVLNPAVIDKMRFVHRLVRGASWKPAPAALPASESTAPVTMA